MKKKPKADVSDDPNRPLQVGDTVKVTTVYTIKRIDNHSTKSQRSALVGVEDDYGDRVVNFRLEELERVI